MESTAPILPVLPLNRAARKLGVSARWLRAEIEGGRVPGLIAGTAVLVNVEAAAAVLAERAAAPQEAAKCK
jgi:hypothetical protein